MTDRLRETTLTVLGAVGYLAFLLAAGAKSAGYPVTWELIGVILLTSSAFLGVDFGLDVIPAWAVDRGTRDSHDKRDKER